MNSSTTNGAGGWTSYPPECERINLTNCTIRNYGYSAQGSANPSIQFAKGSRITNLRIADRRFPPPTPFVIFVHPDDLQLTNVVSDTQMNFEGQNLRLLNVSAPLVYFTLTSSGILLAPLAAGTLEDGSAALDQPLTVRSNGVVRVPMFAQAAVHGPDLIVQANPDAVALQVRSLTPTTAAHLMEWQNGLGSPMFAVRTDGFLATGQSDLSGTIGQIVRKLPIFDIDGNLLGYIPIYDNL